MDVLRGFLKRSKAKPPPTQTNPESYTTDVKRSALGKTRRFNGLIE
jgi:hypothetical protein